MPALIEIKDLAHSFAGKQVLDLASWEMRAGEVVAVTGPSGSGKSTLLHILAGLLAPDLGSISVCGLDWRGLAASARDAARGRQIGIVFQGLHLINAVSIRDNLRLAQKLAARPRDDARITSVLSALSISATASARPTDLSQGERQRAAIARAVINRPALILADEPTSSLDDDNAETVTGLLRAQALECGAGLIVATHDRRIHGAFERVLDLGAAP